MPIQPENKATPFLIPPSPQNKESLLKWAQDINLVFSQINRQFVDKYNLHLDQTYAHPKSWDTWKLPRPAYNSNSAATSQVLLPASSTQPANFLIGGKLLQSTSTLTMDLNTAGPGGLRSGLTKAANTIYYLYGVNNLGSVALLSDTNDPGTGPSGFSDWTYLGSFFTIAASAIGQFRTKQGFLNSANRIEVLTQTGSTSYTSKTIKMPTTAKFAWGLIDYSGTNVGTFGAVRGYSAGDDVLYAYLNVSGQNMSIAGLVQLEVSNTIYLKTSNASNTTSWVSSGWLEFPEEFK